MNNKTKKKNKKEVKGTSGTSTNTSAKNSLEKSIQRMERELSSMYSFRQIIQNDLIEQVKIGN